MLKILKKMNKSTIINFQILKSRNYINKYNKDLIRLPTCRL